MPLQGKGFKGRLTFPQGAALGYFKAALQAAKIGWI